MNTSRWWHQPVRLAQGLELEYINAYEESYASDTWQRNGALAELWALTH